MGTGVFSGARIKSLDSELAGRKREGNRQKDDAMGGRIEKICMS